MNNKQLKYLGDYAAEITRQLQREHAKNLKIFVGQDYQQHLDETYDRIHERGYNFIPSLSTNMLINGGYIARLNLQRLVPQEIFKKPLGERTCPYGAWFEWTIGIMPDDELAVTVIRNITDPTKIEKDGNTFLQDSMREVFPVCGNEMPLIFRRETIKALSQLRDFSHLNPEPPIIRRNDKDYTDFIKSMWKDYGD